MERVDENGRDHRSSIFYVFLLFHLPPCVCFIAMDGRRTRRRMKYKGFNEASLSLTHSLTHTHTASLFTAPSQGSSLTPGFYGAAIKQQKTNGQ